MSIIGTQKQLDAGRVLESIGKLTKKIKWCQEGKDCEGNKLIDNHIRGAQASVAHRVLIALLYRGASR